MVPTVEKCFRLMEKYEMLENIRAHSIVVRKVADLIAGSLVQAGIEISLRRVTAGALLHDIAKTPCLHTNEDHAARGREICLRNDLAEIADIVGQHVRLNGFEPHGRIREGEIVYYADKRVNHDEVVTLDQRLGYLLVRYGNGDEYLCRRMRENFEICRKVEKKLFAPLKLDPLDVRDLIK